MTSENEAPGLWARSRRRAYDEITAVAMDLFLSGGFERTTIDQIAAAAGISRRSFFRYFGTKEDIVVGHFGAEGAVLREILQQRPEDEDIWAALRGAMVAAEANARDEERMLAIARMLYRTPSLRARSIEKHLRWYDDVVPEVERRLGGEGAALRARAIVGCVITCLDLAGEAWMESDAAEPLMVYFDRALEAIHRS
jgi:AcrR family transcriptional regulator